MTFCIDHNTSRYTDKFEDSLGRWSTISMVGRHHHVVHFITVYQAVAKESSGPYTAFQQQLQCLRLADRTLPLRRAFLVDFEKYLKSFQTATSQFVIMGDFNDVAGNSLSSFAKITSMFSLVDILGHFHSVHTEVSTYARGPNRLDYIFCSDQLLSAVERCGAEPFNQHVFSDHRALFVDWDTLALFGAQTPTVTPSAHRRLQSKFLPSRQQYIHELHRYCTDHNVFARLKTLSEFPSPYLTTRKYTTNYNASN
jgi:hypothetical protein